MASITKKIFVGDQFTQKCSARAELKRILIWASQHKELLFVSRGPTFRDFGFACFLPLEGLDFNCCVTQTNEAILPAISTSETEIFFKC